MTSPTVDQPSSGPRDRPPLVHRWLTGSIHWYQRARAGRPSPCRFFPSCSSYALEAIEVHGSRHGAWLAVKRLARCRPLGPSGFDPVPEAGTDHDGQRHPHPDSSPDHHPGSALKGSH